jgi:hypothetical protein
MRDASSCAVARASSATSVTMPMDRACSAVTGFASSISSIARP